VVVVRGRAPDRCGSCDCAAMSGTEPEHLDREPVRVAKDDERVR
jgi:hypothetical protein